MEENKNWLEKQIYISDLGQIFETIGSEVPDPLEDLPKETQKRIRAQIAQENISPDDWKYSQSELISYLSPGAEWKFCALVQFVLLQTRAEMGEATQKDVKELEEALKEFDPVNAAFLEKTKTKHDQLAVIEELGNHISPRVKALLHPGTTSYDILDTARAYAFKEVYEKEFRSVVEETIKKLADTAEKLAHPENEEILLQVGRTHLQDTSPVPFASTLAGYAARLADRLTQCDAAFASLKWKISGIVGTGASVEMVVGEGKQMEFEKKALNKLGLKPDYTATQIVQKESLADVGNSLTTLIRVLGDFANDMRILYSSAIWEVTSRDGKARLWWSSADAAKNNPINWENIAGKVAVVESKMRILYEMIPSDLQRDLRGSVQARYIPEMISEVYESFTRAAKALDSLSINKDKMNANLEHIRQNPSEALVAILRGIPWWEHSKYGVWHDFVKEMAKQAQKEGKNLLEVCLADMEFAELFTTLTEDKQAILRWELEKYVWTSLDRKDINIAYAREVITSTTSKAVKQTLNTDT